MRIVPRTTPFIGRAVSVVSTFAGLPVEGHLDSFGLACGPDQQ
jgi:hypothetical protein